MSAVAFAAAPALCYQREGNERGRGPKTEGKPMPSSPRRLRRQALPAATAAVAALALAAAPGAAGTGPDVLGLPNGWQPEGIAAGNHDLLYVGSIPTGRVLRLDARTGRTRVVVPQREGHAAVGLKVARGRIFVAGGTTGRAFVYDARTGAELANVKLADAPSFVNDVVVTRTAAYFTDSQRPQLYRLPIRRNGAPAARARTLPVSGDLRYDTDPQTFEANGITVAPDGRALLVVQSRNGRLFRVDPTSGASRQVTLTGGDGEGLVAGDGLLLVGRTLYAVQNQRNRIAVVRLSRTASRGRIATYLRDRDLDVPTTVARRGRDLFAVNARFGTPPTPQTRYDVVRVRTR